MYLNCHTGFSFKYGTLPIEGLFNEAKRCGVHKLVLTEIHNTASYMEMLRYAPRIASTKMALQNSERNLMIWISLWALNSEKKMNCYTSESPKTMRALRH